MLTSEFKNLIEGVDKKVPLGDGRTVPYINFDNAATTPPLKIVLQEIINFAPWYSSVHRGTGYKSKLTSDFYEDSRRSIMDFVCADAGEQTVIYVKNTTEGINKLSNRLSADTGRDIVLSTDMEHHSNDLPWRRKYKVMYVAIDEDGRLSMEDLKAKLEEYSEKIALVTVTGASNVTGYINNIYDIAELSHSFGVKICVDGAQLVPHVPIDIGCSGSPRHIDYLVFSAHKMYAPFGTGILIGPKENFEHGDPDYSGGGTIEHVTHSVIKWADPPEKEEAGSPNVMGIVALIAAIRALTSIGMSEIQKYENNLMEYALSKMRKIDGITMYGGMDGRERVGIIPFNIDGMSDDIAANILAGEAGIAVRNGCFCAQPYMRKLLKLSEDAENGGMVRVSFGLYNTTQEIDVLISVLRYIIKNRTYFNEKYKYLLY